MAALSRYLGLTLCGAAIGKLIQQAHAGQLDTFREQRQDHPAYGGKLLHIGLGRTHARTRVLLLVQDRDVTIIHATTGQIVRELTIDPPETTNLSATADPQTHQVRTPAEGSDLCRCLATSHGAGDGNRTRTVSLGRPRYRCGPLMTAL
jgi:hypothetical protein